MSEEASRVFPASARVRVFIDDVVDAIAIEVYAPDAEPDKRYGATRVAGELLRSEHWEAAMKYEVSALAEKMGYA